MKSGEPGRLRRPRRGMRGSGGDVADGVARVVIAAGYGGPGVLAVAEEPVGEPGPGEARIEVRAAGVNPVDVKSYSGAFGADPARLPIRLGAEAAGVVTAVGPGAEGPAGPVNAGDEVIAYRAPGAYASELVVPGGAVVPKPPTLDWAQAAGLMVTGVTAWHLLTATSVSAGDTVLIHGGSGGVGLMTLQLAVIRGAKVVATASPARHDLLAELGAVPVAYGPGLAERVAVAAPGGIDVALDLVGTDEAWDTSLGLVPTALGWPRSLRSARGCRRASRCSAARRAPIQAPRSGSAPGWTWPGSPGKGSCGLSSAGPSRWPRPRPRTA